MEEKTARTTTDGRHGNDDIENEHDVLNRKTLKADCAPDNAAATRLLLLLFVQIVRVQQTDDRDL